MNSCKTEPQLTGTKEWAATNENFLVGCRNDCVYCYAKRMAVTRFHRTMDWTQMAVNERAIQKGFCKRSGTIMFPSSHDLFPEHLPIILKQLRKMLLAKNKVLIVSKPRAEVISEICRVVQNWFLRPVPDLLEFRFTITSATDSISLQYEPGAPLPLERVKCIQIARAAGYPVSVSIEPYLEAPCNIIKFIAHEGGIAATEITHYWIGSMNHGHPAELTPIYSREYMYGVWKVWKAFDKVRFKNSFRDAGICDSNGRAL
jgi:hypothetical protein